MAQSNIVTHVSTNAPTSMPGGGILSDIPNLWIVLGIGVALWFLSQQLATGRPGSGSALLARLMSLLGIVAIGIGLYAGFMGPVTIGPVTMKPFPFAGLIRASNFEALTYARSSLSISRHPANGWNGGSRTTLEYVVMNKGQRTISRLIFRFITKDGSSTDLPLDGTFSGGQTVSAIVTPPPNALSTYFTNSVVDLNEEVIAARF
jgi:hypothetical protein